MQKLQVLSDSCALPLFDPVRVTDEKYLHKICYRLAVVFAVMAGIVFATGSSWGVFVVSLPIVIPMAITFNVSMPLMVGALLSASAFGSHSCFYSDSTVLSAQGSGCTPMQHALTQLPYALIGAVLAFISLLVLGYAVA